MKGALPALAIVAAFAAAAAPPTGAWVVVGKDGSRVSFSAKPDVRSEMVVGRLVGSGTLVSIPVARVDDEATRKANEAGAAAKAPAEAKTAPKPRPFETPPLGDRVKLKASGEEAARVLESSRKGTPAPAPSPAVEAATGAGRTPSPAEPADRQGRGEAWWRERASVVRGYYEAAARSLADAEARREAAERAWLGGSQAERNTFVLRVNEERAAAERAREEYRRASSAWEALQDDARRSGALPGWLR